MQAYQAQLSPPPWGRLARPHCIVCLSIILPPDSSAHKGHSGETRTALHVLAHLCWKAENFNAMISMQARTYNTLAEAKLMCRV